jgi:YHS domain-containing protein
MKLTPFIVATTISIAVVAVTQNAFAADEYNVPSGTTANGEGVALRGYDPVALALGLGITDGHAKLTYVHDGVAYYFASEASMNAFAANPGTYMPQYGGYCAFGVALGKKLDGSPRFADIVDGKLYLFLNAAVFEAYQKDREGTLAKAARNWPGMHHVPVSQVNS